MSFEKEELIKKENRKLKELITYLESKNNKYVEYIKELGVKIESVQFNANPFNDGLTGEKITYERLSVPDFIIVYKGERDKILQEIKVLVGGMKNDFVYIALIGGFMKEIYLTNEEIEFLFRWFNSTTNGVQIDSFKPREDAKEEDKQIYNSLKDKAKVFNIR